MAQDLTPIAQYRRHSNVYDSIADSVEETRQAFLDAPRRLQRIMLQQATTFALLSTQTAVEKHETGYLNVLEAGAHGQESLADVIRDSGVNYCNNKARYILHNLSEADADRVIDHIEAGNQADALGAINDEFMGVGMAKGAYSLAKLGVPEMACIDTHVSQFLGIDQEDIYTGVVPEKYLDQVSQLDELQVADEFDRRFMTQWLVFDTNRGGVTTHMAWFASIPDKMGVTPPGIQG